MVDLKLAKPVKKAVDLGAPPPRKASAAVENLHKPASTELVPFQVRVSPEVRRQFKSHAAERDMNISQLFDQVWKFYKDNHA